MTRAHAIAGTLAWAFVLTFWVSSATVELFGPPWAILAVKQGILWAMLGFVPLMATAGASGFRLGRGRLDRHTRAKRNRMKWIAGIGLLVLLPLAVFLRMKAVAGELDTTFAIAQGVELVAGAINGSLLGLQVRDGLRMTGRLSRRRRSTARTGGAPASSHTRSEVEEKLP